MICILVYPLYGHWVWGGGWLSQLGHVDFAGSGVVHAVGGFFGLGAAIVLGPRFGKFAKDGTPKAIPGHSMTLAAVAGAFGLDRLGIDDPVGAVSVHGINGVWVLIVFKLLDLVMGVRVPAEEEIKGLDIPEHGSPAYPDFYTMRC